MKKSLVLAGLFLFLAASNSFAYRPLATEDAGVAGKGVAQAEISWDSLKWENDDLEQVFMLVPIYGVTENLELSVEIPYRYHRPASGTSEEGTGDINIVGKYLLIPGGTESPAFAVKGVVKMDNGDYDKGLGSGDKDYSIVAALSETVGQFTGHAQVGYTWTGDKKDKRLDVTLYGAALDFALSEFIHILAEVTAERHPDRLENENPLIALVGITFKVSDNLVMDAAYRWGLNDSVSYTSTTVGASITF